MSYATSDKRIAALKDERKQLISAKQDLERRIDELCAEVERLRKAKDTMHGDAFEIGAMLVKARDENAKLREQVDYMTPIALYAASEHERDRMRELGVEL